MEKVSKGFLIFSGIAGAALIAGLLLRQPALSMPFALVSSISLAIGLGAVPSLKGYRYTAWIIVAVVAGMLYPGAFSSWGGLDLRNKTVILIIVQLVMFGMGTHMSLKDFKGVATTGKGVTVGLLCHFSIMPLVGFLLTKLFHFNPEIAAGIILIGSCSSGLASNVMVYLARANLALSVVVTAASTMAAPFLTPLLMKTFAGALIEVKFVNMMIEIVKIVLVPIGAALLHDYLKRATPAQKRKIYTTGACCAVWLLFVIFILQGMTHDARWLQSINLSGFFAGACVAGIVYHWIYDKWKGIDKAMPLISMFGIIYFTLVTTAAGRDNLLRVGALLLLASVIHNAAGYFFGYWLSRLLRLDKNSSRTIAFEVGLQNGGMATGIAGSMGKLGTVGLASAVFSPWMNISGSILANYWHKHPVIEKEAQKNQPAGQLNKIVNE